MRPSSNHQILVHLNNFASQIWIQHTAEAMGAKADPEVYYRTIVAFASAIGMAPIELRKGHTSYVLNLPLAQFLDDALALLMEGAPSRRPRTSEIDPRSGTA